MNEDKRQRALNNGMFVMDLGYRKEQPIALVERTFNDGTKEYIIAFNYEIKDNTIDWSYGYYYSNDIGKAKTDFKRALNGENLANTFTDKVEEKEPKEDFEFEFYTEEEIKELIKSKAELFYVDDGIDEAIIRFEDIPDFIVDYNKKIEMRDLKFFKVGKDIYEPDITTYGEFLNSISPDLRERMIDRLVELQTDEAEPKKYKIINEDVFSQVKDKLEQEQAALRKQKNKYKEAR